MYIFQQRTERREATFPHCSRCFHFRPVIAYATLKVPICHCCVRDSSNLCFYYSIKVIVEMHFIKKKIQIQAHYNLENITYKYNNIFYLIICELLRITLFNLFKPLLAFALLLNIQMEKSLILLYTTSSLPVECCFYCLS